MSLNSISEAVFKLEKCHPPLDIILMLTYRHPYTKKISLKKNVKIPKRLSGFQKLLNSDNFNRFKCIFLPIDAVLKALKL